MTCESGMAGCYAKASVLCRAAKWRFLDTSVSSEGRAFAANGVMAARSEATGAALLECDMDAPPVKQGNE